MEQVSQEVKSRFFTLANEFFDWCMDWICSLLLSA